MSEDWSVLLLLKNVIKAPTRDQLVLHSQAPKMHFGFRCLSAGVHGGHKSFRNVLETAWPRSEVDRASKTGSGSIGASVTRWTESLYHIWSLTTIKISKQYCLSRL